MHSELNYEVSSVQITVDVDGEIFPLIDQSFNVIGKASRRYCHGGSMALHPVVHLHIFNSQGELYLQKRAMHKDIQPGKWDTAVGGHVDYGETIATALAREAREELGLNIEGATHLFSYVFESDVEREMVNAFRITFDGDIHPDPDEVTEGRFWPLEEIRCMIGRSVFTPNFENEFIKLMNVL